MPITETSPVFDPPDCEDVLFGDCVEREGLVAWGLLAADALVGGACKEFGGGTEGFLEGGVEFVGGGDLEADGCGAGEGCEGVLSGGFTRDGEGLTGDGGVE